MHLGTYKTNNLSVSLSIYFSVRLQKLPLKGGNLIRKQKRKRSASRLPPTPSGQDCPEKLRILAEIADSDAQKPDHWKPEYSFPRKRRKR